MGWCPPKNLFLSLDLWCKDLVPQKRKNCFGHWTVFIHWSDGRLCTRDGSLKADALRGRCHPKSLFLSLDLCCNDLFPKREKKLFRTLDCLYTLSGRLTLYKRWETKSWPLKGSVSPKKSLPWSVVQRLVPKKEDKLFRTLDCLYALIRFLTLYKQGRIHAFWRRGAPLKNGVTDWWPDVNNL